MDGVVVVLVVVVVVVVGLLVVVVVVVGVVVVVVVVEVVNSSHSLIWHLFISVDLPSHGRPSLCASWMKFILRRG